MKEKYRFLFLIALVSFFACSCSTIPFLSTSDKGEIVLYWDVDVHQDTQIQNVTIYRSDRRYGYYEKIPLTLKKVLIEATQRYRYTIRDTSVVPGKTYFYYLESVYMDGRREVSSPILEFLAREKQ